jgi:hypothetical protein
VDDGAWSKGDEFNFHMWGKFVPTVLLGELVGAFGGAALAARVGSSVGIPLYGGFIQVGLPSAHQWGAGIAMGVHGIVEGLDHGLEAHESHNPDGQSGSQSSDGRTDPHQDTGLDSPGKGDAPDDKQPDGGKKTVVYIDVDSGDRTVVVTTPPPTPPTEDPDPPKDRPSDDDRPGDDGTDENKGRERLVKAQAWAEAVGAVKFVSTDPLTDETPVERGVIVVGKWAGLPTLLSEPVVDEDSVAARLRKVERWLGEVASGEVGNGADGWYFVPGRGGWVMQG